MRRRLYNRYTYGFKKEVLYCVVIVGWRISEYLRIYETECAVFKDVTRKLK